MQKKILVLLFLVGAYGALFGQGTWSSASSEGFLKRCNATANTVNGKIYVIGGDSLYKALNLLDVFDPVTNTWKRPITTGNFEPRNYHTSAVVGDKIYVIGGWDKNADDISYVSVFDPATNHWSTLATTGTWTPRRNATASVVGEKIYVIAGDTSSWLMTNIVEILDTKTNEWQKPLIEDATVLARSSATSVVVGTDIYLIGGAGGPDFVEQLDIFDTRANNWRTLETQGKFRPRGSLSSCLIGDKIYAIGGFSYGPMSYVEVLDIPTMTWDSLETTGHFTPRGWLASSLVNGPNGPEIYAIGGSNNSKVLNVNEVLKLEKSSVAINQIADITIVPNPVANEVTLSYTLAKSAPVRIDVFDPLGRSVYASGEGFKQQGNHSLTLSAGDWLAGAYYIRLSTPSGEVRTVKVMKE